MPRLFRLNGTIQHYGWGGYEYIPQLLGLENKLHQPFAEYWLGAHDRGPAEIILPDGAIQLLDQFIGQQPEILGRPVQEIFGGLPYLFKVLDVREMLSIQVHPSRQEAKKGFERENALGIPLEAANRNYKDTNHKPEVMVALTEFWLLHGFLPEEQLIRVIREVPELRILEGMFTREGYFGLYKMVMEWEETALKKLLDPLIARIVPAYREGRLHPEDPAYWCARALAEGICSPEHPDRGMLSIYFFNLVHLMPGEGIFQGAGVPHAYLEGRNMELMANSDNVLRGGLTTKYVDVPELLRHVRFTETIPQILTGDSISGSVEKKYTCPVPDFVLSRIHLQNKEKYRHLSTSADILVVISGSVLVQGSGKLDLHKGQAMIAFCGEEYEITGQQESLIFQAAVP